ncbi:hypothetical protein J7T55_009018 [Diaporthe amygdali]|uniref:uncharacterized protein n=1 Tax=Phomopsis amygdali TaxID=1214568 RepID=UPI0022FF36ED|nr:uncharacterized protein J7T55_009018 [Diaporthe amygdali]KAJ0118235.1 hypothetical protein J7T55_009018 [Diaporthe amygdali]
MLTSALGGEPQGNFNPDDLRAENEDDDGPITADDIDQLTSKLTIDEQHISAGLEEKTLGGLIRVLMVQIYWRASALFSTTYVAVQPLVKKYTKTANEYFIDEAGCATIAETSNVAATISAGHRYAKRTGFPPSPSHPVNPLARQHMLSLLKKLMLDGCDLSYGQTCEVENHDLGQRCEDWAVRKLGVERSPGGSLLPLFVNIPRTRVQYTEVSKSRSKPLMLDAMIRILNRLIQGANLSRGDIAIVTPYQAQQNEILEKMGADVSVMDIDNKVPLTTADRVQGNERPVVVLLAVNTSQSGAGFLWDSNRMNVISTRASDYFVVVGDIQMAAREASERTMQSSGGYIDTRDLEAWIRYFERNRRVVEQSEVQWLSEDDASFGPERFHGSQDN